MATGDRRPVLLVLVSASVLAAGLGVVFSRGTVDSPQPPGPPTDGGTGPLPVRPPGFPDLTLRAGDFPEPAAAALVFAWQTAAGGDPPATVAALRALAPPGAPGPLDGCAPRALEAFAPVIEHLVMHGRAAVPTASLRVATELARRGGAAGREALRRSGLIPRAYAVQAVTGPAEFRVEAARLLGLAGGPEAAEWLAAVLDGAPETSVRESAVHALAEVHRAGTRLPHGAVLAVKGALESSEETPSLRIACLQTMNAAFRDFEASFAQEGLGTLVVAALQQETRPPVRLAAAHFLQAHPLEEAGPALLRALTDPDPFIVEPVAEALGEVRPPGAREALEGRLPTLTDPRARAAVELAIRKNRGR